MFDDVIYLTLPVAVAIGLSFAIVLSAAITAAFILGGTWSARTEHRVRAGRRNRFGGLLR